MSQMSMRATPCMAAGPARAAGAGGLRNPGPGAVCPVPASARFSLRTAGIKCHVAEISRSAPASVVQVDGLLAQQPAPAAAPPPRTSPYDALSLQHAAFGEDAHRIQASHLSLEGDLNPEAVWPSWLRSAQPSPTNEEAPSDQGPSHPLAAEAVALEAFVAQLQAAPSLSDQVTLLMRHERVQAFLQDPRRRDVVRALYSLPAQEQRILLSLAAMGQDHVLALPDTDGSSPPADGVADLPARLTQLAASLLQVDRFYNSIGGILGYQCRSLRLIIAGSVEIREQRSSQDPAGLPTGPESVTYHVPQAVDLAGEDGREVGMRMAVAGLAALPTMAEIYPLGGAGDRLGLVCEETGECLPAAMLPYCGRTMLEGLMRDLQAREHLYFRVTGQQVTVPVAIMSSEAKGNHTRITSLFEKLRWFGRGRDAFRIFKQPLVPVIGVEDGAWLLSGVMRPMTKPGGHGAIWKLMWDQGVFEWLGSQGRTAALVRQISNPMAGMDTTLLALTGCGAGRKDAAFGFMSCDRTIGAAEGCNVLQERKVAQADGSVSYQYGYTNIEYTEFERLGISDQPVDGTSRRSVFPANTNVLYVGLEAARRVVADAIASASPEQLMPGLIFNLKKKVAYTDPLSGQARALHAGRMECTMQNIADYMTASLGGPLSPAEAGSSDQLPTFLVYNMRRKVTSSAKKKRVPGSTKISQTPDGSFYDLQRNAWHLLQQCSVAGSAEPGSVEQYLESGPGFIFLYNPGLGPLWDVIAQKLVGGSLQQGSEMVLEVAEARLIDVHVNGSFIVRADNVLGHVVRGGQEGEEGRLVYSNQCGRVNMTNVRIENRGIDWQDPANTYWKHQVARRESVQVLLRGQSEFEAHDLTLVGSHTFEVPDGYRMVVSQDPAGCLMVSMSPLSRGRPTWHWNYTMDQGRGSIHLEYVSSLRSSPSSGAGGQGPHDEASGWALPAPAQPASRHAAVWLRNGEATGEEGGRAWGPEQHLGPREAAAVGGRWGGSGPLSSAAVAQADTRLRLLQQLREIDVVLDFTI